MQWRTFSFSKCSPVSLDLSAVAVSPAEARFSDKQNFSSFYPNPHIRINKILRTGTEYFETGIAPDLVFHMPVYDAIEHNKFTALLLMDLRKAFDTVSHQILLQKLLHYGIRGPAYCLMESYLSNRQQFVSINNSASSLKSISIGVPQGSIFGPLLFLIYVNDLTNATFCQLRLFADKTCLALDNSTLNALEVNCNCELRRLRNWCTANELQINPEKSTIIIFPPKLNLPQPEVNFI